MNGLTIILDMIDTDAEDNGGIIEIPSTRLDINYNFASPRMRSRSYSGEVRYSHKDRSQCLENDVVDDSVDPIPIDYKVIPLGNNQFRIIDNKN